MSDRQPRPDARTITPSVRQTTLRWRQPQQPGDRVCSSPGHDDHYGGVTLGWVEGIEINLLGAALGVEVRRPAINLPGLGRFGI
jgi:hypothetical protein